MPGMNATPLDLSTFDGKLLDGLVFCPLVYDLFDQIQNGPDGVERLRLRKTKTDKRLVEELLPLAAYVQARYRPGRRLKVRWLGGSQPYDAILLSSGGLVSHGMAPRRIPIEIMGSMHQNEYLARQLLHKQGGSFGVKGITRDKRTGEVKSEPHVHHNDEIMVDLADRILARLRDKAEKNYPRNTVLLMQCFANTLTLETEWNEAVRRVEAAQPTIPFREVFLLEPVGSYSATLYGDRKRRHARRIRKRLD
jgi:hypothetical protein